MIVYDLSCDNGHRFEGWFGSSEEFTSQKERGLLCCPECGSADVSKAPMAPAVGQKGNQQSAAVAMRQDRSLTGSAPMANAPLPPEVAKAVEKLAKAQATALRNSKWVGKEFAEQSRAMHYGEREHEAIHGEATSSEAKDLIDEGVPVAPLPFPVAPPDELN
jgi:hypothetical protein